MKKLIAIFVVLSFLGCSVSTKKLNEFEKINKENITEIIIKKSLDDSLKYTFNNEEENVFLNLINNRKNLKLLKAQPKFWIVVKFKNGDERKFKVLDNYIGNNDWYVKTDKAKFFEDIYKNGLKN
jgi:hypothetical protein